MLVVVDANELFSLLIRGTEKSEAILFSERAKLIAPELLLTEFSRHKQELLSKTHRSEEGFARLVSILERRIELIPKVEFEQHLSTARSLFPEHTKDVPYLALALAYNCALWTEEKRLKKQSSVLVVTTKELF